MTQCALSVSLCLYLCMCYFQGMVFILIHSISIHTVGENYLTSPLELVDDKLREFEKEERMVRDFILWKEHF